MQRAARRRRVADLRPVRARRQQRGHDDGNGGQQRRAHRRRRQRLDAGAHASERLIAGRPIRQHESGDHVERQQRDLIPSDRHQSGEHAGRHPRPPRRALERAGDEPERQRQIREADDLDGVLHPGIGGAAERDRHRRHQRASRVPAAVAEEQDDADSAQEQIGEGHGIEGAQADRGFRRGEQRMQRGEHQRLRIGNLRPAGEDVGRPPRPFAARQRSGEELHLRKELRFRIPRDRHRAGEPRPGRHQECEREYREADGERNARRRGCGGRRRLPGVRSPRVEATIERRRVAQAHVLFRLMHRRRANHTPRRRSHDPRRCRTEMHARRRGGSSRGRALA